MEKVEERRKDRLAQRPPVLTLEFYCEYFSLRSKQSRAEFHVTFEPQHLSVTWALVFLFKVSV